MINLFNINKYAPLFYRFSSIILMLCSSLTIVDLKAQDYPIRPVHIVVPFPPGSFTDTLPRMLAERLSKEWGRPVIIDNKPGAAGRIAAEFVSRAPADGYTLLAAGPDQLTIAPHLYRTIRYTLKDFTPVSLMWRQTLVFVVRTDMPESTVAEIVRTAKAKSRTLSWASWGEGSLGHLSLEHFKLISGTDIIHVPFGGSLAGTTAVASKTVDMMITGYATARPLIDAGKVRLMASAGKTRAVDSANIPTIAEAGYPGYESVTWSGLVAPKGTPQSVVNFISGSVAKILSSTEINEKLTASYVEIKGSSPEEFGKLIQEDETQWINAIKGAKIQLD